MNPATGRTRRLAGLAGLLAAVAVAVAAKDHTASPVHPVSLGSPVTGGPTAPPAPGSTAAAPGSAAPPRSTAAATPSGRFVGAVEETRFGPVQVAVHLVHGRITDVAALQLPSDAPRSQQIAGYAAPLLRQEVLTTQGAQIDTVSGATYTSEGYAQSVQAALDAAGRH